jgi:predicted RNA methylase
MNEDKDEFLRDFDLDKIFNEIMSEFENEVKIYVKNVKGPQIKQLCEMLRNVQETFLEKFAKHIKQETLKIVENLKREGHIITEEERIKIEELIEMALYKKMQEALSMPEVKQKIEGSTKALEFFIIKWAVEAVKEYLIQKCS